ncbi:L-aminopeptidase/D-esterase [Frankia torreyi]|uniref:L-aminopeptidase/D-esterase n=1 Tax=Frankia torreyi TaxID=1856 RepID=A0A0D8BED1_9ACTN|nr:MULTISPECIES: P1 family peptidase [Frankia]KJE22410.1 L-aminopeptidase/D-esterase [Frankia torreyi]KQC37416.1 peptidase S58 DmpA [Frankia sp. ACN1ag]
MAIGVDGVRVGHWTDPVGVTGCTVVELPVGTVASAEVRGGAPASRELDALAPHMALASIDAVLLTGGSAFGLAAADGVMRYYAERGRGVPTSGGPVPVVPALALFDLAVGAPTARPTADAGYLAARATGGEQVLRGRVGAGTGAYASQWRGPEYRGPGGLGHAYRCRGEVSVAALCVVNAFGDIDHGGDPVPLDAAESQWRPFDLAAGRTHTTIGVVVTNARLDKTSCLLVAQGAHDGLARAITPPHTRLDGDAFVAAATGRVEADVDLVRLLALAAVTAAIRSVDRSP